METKIDRIGYAIQKVLEEELVLQKHFKQAWLPAQKKVYEEKDVIIFEYADRAYNDYHFAITRLNDSIPRVMKSIFITIFSEYGIESEWPDEKAKKDEIPFDFIAVIDRKRIGCSLSGYYVDEDIAELKRAYNLDELLEILLYRPGIADTWIKRNDSSDRGISSMNLKHFLDSYVSVDVYPTLMQYIDNYLEQIKRIIGYKAVPYLSEANLSFFKDYTKEKLEKFDYYNTDYSILDAKKLYEIRKGYIVKAINSYKKDRIELAGIYDCYINNKNYLAMIGLADFAKSFITSEWLYDAFNDKGYFDYTAIISGYLKSIEQLLSIITRTFVNKSLPFPKRASKETEITITTSYNKKVDCVYLTERAIENNTIDETIGGLRLFFEINRTLFWVKSDTVNAILNMIDCFGTECRNGHFHKHNLYDWSIVKKTRENVWLLYFYILGSIKVDIDRPEFNLVRTDMFDSICMKIRKHVHYSSKFEFEYEDGTVKKMIYDTIENTAEYNIEGTEHYLCQYFIPVDDFEMSTLDRLNEIAATSERFVLSRENLPVKIRNITKDGIRNIIP